MPFDDQAPARAEPPLEPPSEGAADTDARSERRSRRAARSWSGPEAAAERDRFDKPISESEWGWQRAAPGRADGGATPAGGPTEAPAASPNDSEPVAGLMAELRAELSHLRESLAEVGPEASLVTGAELAATIQTLGTTLGTGMASLLSDHRALLARDLDAASHRILDELGQRLRVSGTQTVDTVEERLRHVSTKATTDLSEQLELRLDQIQAEMTGLRAVMLEIPDQAVLSARLDELGAAFARLGRQSSPGSIAGAIEQIETAIAGAGEAVRALIEERLPEGLPAPVGIGESIDGRSHTSDLSDTSAIVTLTNEMTALRRRIALRSEDRAGDQPGLSDAQLDQLADRVAARLRLLVTQPPISAPKVNTAPPAPIPVAKPALARKRSPRKATDAAPTKQATTRKRA